MKLCLLIVVLITVVDAGNILGVFLYPCESHHILGSTLLGNLAKRGHNVTYISPFKSKAIYPNFTHFVVDDIVTYEKEHLGSFDRLKVTNTYERLFFENLKIQWFLKSDSTFDLMIHFVGFDAGLALSHHFDVPVMIFSPAAGLPYTDEFFGNPAPVSYVPHAYVPFSDDMNFYQRLMNALHKLIIDAGLRTVIASTNKAIQRYLPGTPSIEDMQSKIEMGLINSHISTETPRPYLPAMVQIGGFHLQEPEPLPADLMTILDGATNGVIYFSFGTSVEISDLAEDKLDILIRSLGKLPMKVLIKFEKDGLDNKPDNVEFRSWYPQRGILAHPNTKLFISHGGYGGCTESLYYGVPMICIPFTLDQPRNCADVERRGLGVHLPLNQLTTRRFGEALQKVLHDEKFIENAKMLSELYRRQEMNPMDRAEYWVNHVIRHKGAKHLRAKVLDLTWYQYYLIDVIAFLLSTVMVVATITYYSFKYFLCRIFRGLQKIKTF